MRGPFDEVVKRQELEDKRLAKEMRKYSGHCIFYIVSFYIFYICVICIVLTEMLISTSMLSAIWMIKLYEMLGWIDEYQIWNASWPPKSTRETMRISREHVWSQKRQVSESLKMLGSLNMCFLGPGCFEWQWRTVGSVFIFSFSLRSTFISSATCSAKGSSHFVNMN